MVKRRPNGEGMIRQKKKGQWEGRIVVGHKENGVSLSFAMYMPSRHIILPSVIAF